MIKTFFIALAFFCIIDVFWIYFVATPMYKQEVAALMELKVAPAIMFYIIFLLGLIFFVINPNLSNTLLNVFMIGAFYAFPPTLAQGASQSIESAKELYDLLIENRQNIESIYFEKRLKKTNMINNRSRLNYFVFHFSNPVFKIFRNQFLKRLIKSKSFIKRYLDKIYN